MLGQVVILGPGLLGGSLALALAQRGMDPVVWGRRQAPLDFLAKQVPPTESIRIEPNLEAAIDGADFVILATPIGVMPALLEQIVARRSLQSGAVITDVGSVKSPIVETATGMLKESGYHFVGSHPMAGSEASGVEAAQVDLFKDAMCILTPDGTTDAGAHETTRQFWKTLDCRVHDLAPLQHDQIVAHISHMPHALASLIVGAALADDPGRARFAAGGLFDTTRVASGEPGMWTEILLENRDAVLDALRGMETQLQTLIRHLETGENRAVHRFLLEAKELRDTHIAPQR